MSQKGQRLKELMMAEEQQHHRVNQAAEQLADTIRKSYQALTERGSSAQELNAQLTGLLQQGAREPSHPGGGDPADGRAVG
jgi:hypothetical protein